MKRSDFLKMVPAAGLTFMLNGFPVRSLASNAFNNILGNASAGNGKVIVLIQLTGGNDGLNTIIPLDQYSPLFNARKNILIDESKVLKLNGIETSGLHPAMGNIRDLYNDGRVKIVQGVSYPNPSFSHFRATDIWETGADSSQNLNNGWVGRYLSDELKGYPVGYPNSHEPDPPAIEIGTTVSTCLIGQDVNMGTSVSDIASFYNIITNTVGATPDTAAGHELTFLRFMAQQTQLYTTSLQKAAGRAKNLSDKYPANNPLAEQLKIVARLIGGGLQTQVYVVSIGSFDSHTQQTDVTNTSTGKHAFLLQSLSEAVNGFFDDCKLLKVSERVCAMTFSEFGRRIKSNGGLGTDHGSGGPVMVFGENVIHGFIGTSPEIPQTVTNDDNVPMQHDYRSVYAAVLQDWLGLKNSALDTILLKDYDALPIFKDIVDATMENNPLSQNYPNPVTNETTIRFFSYGGATRILLTDSLGRLAATIYNQSSTAGILEVIFNKGNLPAGIYQYTLYTGKIKRTQTMVIA